MNNISSDIIYIGVNDHKIDLFEGQYKVPNGMSYNSYIVLDEKITIFDTVDASFTHKWISNINEVLGDKKPDYLVISHMEPDHSAGVAKLLYFYPEVTVVGNAKTFAYMEDFYGKTIAPNRLVVTDGQVLETGKHSFKFVFAPFVHWPEVMITYDQASSTLFSADAFGKFGALDYEDDWTCEARRYYFGIVGKYGLQVQALFKKIANLEIKTICPLHGYILNENIDYYLGLYNTWSSYQAETKGVLIAYTSVYGNTAEAVRLLARELERNNIKVILSDLARTDKAENIEDAFRYSHLVLATTTYNGDVFPFMREFISGLVERNFQNRTVAMIENGAWAPNAIKVMKKMLENSKNISYTENNVTIKASISQDNIDSIISLAHELSK